MVLVLCVVQLKRLASPLSLPAIDPGVLSIDFLGTFVFAGVEGSYAGPGLFVSCSIATVACGWWLGEIGLGYECAA